MDQRVLNRRQFSARFAALGSVPVSAALGARKAGAQESSTTDAAKPPIRTVTFPNGTTVPAIGQGSWRLGQGRHPQAEEEEALRTGIALGMTVIDTAEVYGEGRSEMFIGRTIEGLRDRVFLVTKVAPENTSADGVARACKASLRRLRTDYIDLYLLHAPVPASRFSGVVAKFENLRAKGLIRAWGVSNFTLSQMEKLIRVPDGHRCATNQVAYNLGHRKIEQDLMPWCQEHKMPVMAYSPLGGVKSPLARDATLAAVGAKYGNSAAAVALAWIVRDGNVIAIPESGSPGHVRENAAALTIW